MKPLCFVLMPFNRKRDERGREIDFDAVYRDLIAPAVAAADMEAIRADEEQVGGSIHKPMYERLMLCEYAIADLTTANPNVYYELGVRHALRPRSTIILFAEGTLLPFDVAPLRGMPYTIGPDGIPSSAKRDADAVSVRLRAAKANHRDDSPLFQLLEGISRPEVDHEKTDLFRERAAYAKDYRQKLQTACMTGDVNAVKAIADEPELADLANVEAGIIIGLYLSFRDVKAYQEMVDLYARMPPPLQRTRMIREQLGFALNRLRRDADAERILCGLIEECGPNSETNGLLGRVYKDRWDAALKAQRPMEARGYLKKAIASYLAGFEADWRDAYPGVNAVTLMELEEKVDPRQAMLLPLVRYAASRKAERSGDYWDFATLLELAVLARDRAGAEDAAASAAAAARVGWHVETTAEQLEKIAASRAARGEDVAWMRELRTQMLSLSVVKGGEPT